MRHRHPIRGFTLIEVIVALGILGGGLVAVLAMFAPLAEVNRVHDDMLAAVEAAAAVNGHLRQMPFEQAGAALDATFLVSRSTERVGLATDPTWRGNEDRMFFSVTVKANAALSGPGAPAPAWLGFNLQVRWPVAAGATGQRELLVAGSVHR